MARFFIDLPAEMRQQVETIQAAMDLSAAAKTRQQEKEYITHRRELQKNRWDFNEDTAKTITVKPKRATMRAAVANHAKLCESYVKRAAVSSLPPAKRALVVLFQSLDVLGSRLRGGFLVLLGPF